MTRSHKLPLLMIAVSILISCTSNSGSIEEKDSLTDTADAPSAVVTDTVGTIKQETISASEPEKQTVDQTPASTSIVKQATKDVLIPAEVSRGEGLIQGSDCLACHSTNETLIGPSYKDVAGKYSRSIASITYLAKKIKDGGSGVWGDVPMTPHPALTESDAQAMAQYVLSLK